MANNDRVAADEGICTPGKGVILRAYWQSIAWLNEDWIWTLASAGIAIRTLSFCAFVILTSIGVSVYVLRPSPSRITLAYARPSFWNAVPPGMPVISTCPAGISRNLVAWHVQTSKAAVSADKSAKLYAVNREIAMRDCIYAFRCNSSHNNKPPTQRAQKTGT